MAEAPLWEEVAVWADMREEAGEQTAVIRAWIVQATSQPFSAGIAYQPKRGYGDGDGYGNGGDGNGNGGYGGGDGGYGDGYGDGYGGGYDGDGDGGYGGYGGGDG